MAQTYDEIIASLRIARDKCIEALATGGAGAIQEWEIRGRRLRFKDLTREISRIEALISFYERKKSGQSGSSARSRARLRYN
jgi:hypothetical protein